MVAMSGGGVDWRHGATAGGLIPRSPPRRRAGFKRDDDLLGEFLIVVASLCGIAVKILHWLILRNGIVPE
jgi:hypothetical protein